jgi:hypothetical protein
VLSASHAIADLAVARTRERLVKDLIDDGVLVTLDRMVAGDAPIHVVNAREVLVGWLRRTLDLEPRYDPGETLDVPSRALTEMVVEGLRVNDDARLVTVRVIEAGWKARGRVVVKPTIELVAPGMTSSAPQTSL